MIENTILHVMGGLGVAGRAPVMVPKSGAQEVHTTWV